MTLSLGSQMPTNNLHSRSVVTRRWCLRLAITWPRVGGRLQVATTWEGVGAGHHVPYVDFA
jgi:hypothetical protein